MQIFLSNSIGCLFILLMVSFAVQRTESNIVANAGLCKQYSELNIGSKVNCQEKDWIAVQRNGYYLSGHLITGAGMKSQST